MGTPRTLIIGIDGATFDLLDPFFEAGLLPHLRGLSAEGVRGRLQAWPNTNSAAAWSSMVTGCNPGRHGIFGFGDDPRRIGRVRRPTTAHDRRRVPFWCELSDAGQQVGVVNVPISYPADPIKGFMVAGMDAPAVGSRGFAHPADLADELRRPGFEYAIDVPDLGRLSRVNAERALALAEQVVVARSRAMLHWMTTRPWDVFMGVFTTTDRVQHFFWPPASERPGDSAWTPIGRIYALIDRFVGEVLERIDDDTNVVIVSDHGFGPWRHGRHALNQVFAELGLLRYRPSGAGWGGRGLSTLLSLGREYIPAGMQRRLASAMPALRLRAVSEQRYPGIDWANTKAFANNHGSRVYVNLAGREVGGVVRKHEYAALVATIREVVASLRDADSDEPVVRRVWSREELYAGPYREEGADVFVEWDHRNLGDRLRYRGGGRDLVVGRNGTASPRWSGEHRPDGVFIANGPSFRRAREIAGATLYDVAPTVLYCQNRPVPSDMDGRVLEQALRPECLAVRPVRRIDAGAPRHQAGGRLRPAEADAIEDRLRRLGYIE